MPPIFVLNRWHPNYRTDTRFTPLVSKQGPNQRLSVAPVGLRPAGPTRRRNRSGIDNVAFNPFSLQRPMDPEPVQSGFLNDDDWNTLSDPSLCLVLQGGKALQQLGYIAAAH